MFSFQWGFFTNALNTLKTNYHENFEQITNLEATLNNLIDAEILLKVRSIQIFSCLNSEKPTPIFLGLARSSNVSVKGNVQRKLRWVENGVIRRV